MMKLVRSIPLPAAVVLLAGAIISPVRASTIDTWQGLFNVEDVTDTNIFPHKLLDYENAMYFIYSDAPGGTSGTRGSAQDETRFLAAVVGHIFERDDMDVSIGCGFGDQRSYNPVWHFNNPDARRPGATLRDGSDLRNLVGQGLSSPLDLADQFQGSVGVRFGDRYNLGVGIARGSDESTLTNDPLGGGTTTTVGRDVDYTSFTFSGCTGVEMKYLQDVQAAFSFTSGSQAEEEVGKGDNGGWAANVQFDLGYVNNWKTLLQLGLGNFESDFIVEVPDGFTGTIPMEESSLSDWTLDVGGTHQIGRSSVNATFGLMSRTEEFVTTQDPSFERVTIETENDMVPTCGFATSIALTDNFYLDAGAIGSHEKIKTTTTRETTDDREVITVEMKDVMMRYRFGFHWDRSVGDDADGDGEKDSTARISATLDPGTATKNPLGGDSSDPWFANVQLTYTF